MISGNENIDSLLTIKNIFWHSPPAAPPLPTLSFKLFAYFNDFIEFLPYFALNPI